jgi:hypothetical protein
VELIQQKLEPIMSTSSDFLSQANIFVVIINLLMAVTIVYGVIYYLTYLNDKRKRFRLRSGVVRKSNGVKLIQRFKGLRKIYDDLDVVLATKGKEHITDTVFYIYLGGLFLIGMAFLYFKVYIMVILAPIALGWYGKRLIHEMQQDSIVMVERALPSAIDNLVRVSSRYSDVKTIVYETSKLVDEPLRGILDTLSRKMISQNPREALDDFQKEYDNVWLKSVASTLISYLEDSNKEATINNLRNLRDILYQENEGKVKLASERKYGIMMNYALVGAGVVVFIANVLINPNGVEFFFNSFLGLVCMVAGFGTILGTITLNVKLGKIKK